MANFVALQVKRAGEWGYKAINLELVKCIEVAYGPDQDGPHLLLDFGDEYARLIPANAYNCAEIMNGAESPKQRKHLNRMFESVQITA
jgi:hypothetical protein